MKIQTSVFRRKNGKQKGKWTARLVYFDSVAGRTRTIERTAESKTAARDERDRLLAELKKTDGQSIKGENLTFAKLADYCADELYHPAELGKDGLKESGVKSHATAMNNIRMLKEYFGSMLVNDITVNSLTSYRRWRIKKGSQRPEIKKRGEFVPLSDSTINRELSAMRTMMRLALGEGWVTKDIFYKAKQTAKTKSRRPVFKREFARDRMLTEVEEMRLLAACQGMRETTYERTRRGKKETITAKTDVDNPHLKALIILAIDSGMRRGEILKLKWNDIDFNNGIIHILATNTKTEMPRMAPLTERARHELSNIRKFTPGDSPFPFADFKRAWATAKKIARIDDLHFHDLRRTAVTRWQDKHGLSLALAGKVAGHTNTETTMKHYTAADLELVHGLADSMNAYYDRTPVENELVN